MTMSYREFNLNELCCPSCGKNDSVTMLDDTHFRCGECHYYFEKNFVVSRGVVK